MGVVTQQHMAGAGKGDPCPQSLESSWQVPELRGPAGAVWVQFCSLSRSEFRDAHGRDFTNSPSGSFSKGQDNNATAP